MFHLFKQIKAKIKFLFSEISSYTNKCFSKLTDTKSTKSDAERSKREDLNCNCHRCFQDNLLKTHYPWLYEQEMKARDGKILCEKIQDAVL